MVFTEIVRRYLNFFISLIMCLMFYSTKGHVMIVNHQSCDRFNARYMGDRSYSYTCSLLYLTLGCVVPP